MQRTSTADQEAFAEEQAALRWVATLVGRFFTMFGVARLLRRPLVLYAAVTGGYALCSQLSYSWFNANGAGACFFPAAGVTLAALVLSSRRLWPVVIAGAATAELTVDLFHDIALQPALGYVAANTVEPLVGALLLTSYLWRVDLARARHLWAFLMTAVVAGPFVGATIGASTFVVLAEGSGWSRFFAEWWVGDGLGVLVVGGALIGLRSSTVRPAEARLAEALLMGTSCVIATVAVFWFEWFSLVYLPIVLLLGIALRVGTKAVALTGCAVAFIAGEATAEGHVFWESLDITAETGVLYLQLSLGIVIASALVLAAEIAERDRSSIANAESREALARLVDEQAALRRVATLVAMGIEPDELFSAVSDEIARLFTADGAGVGRFEHDGFTVVTVGTSESLRSIPVGSRQGLGETLISGEVYRTGRAARKDMKGDDTGGATALGELARRVLAMGFVSTVGAPIVVEGELWGLVTASSTHATLPADTEQRLESFSELVATAIANAESRAELAASESRARELANEQAALRRVATLVAQGASPDELFSAVAAEVAGIIDIPVVGINRYEADGTFTALGIAGETNFMVGSRWPVEEEGIAGVILATGSPARKDDYSTMPGRLGEAVQEDLMFSTVGVPVIVDGGIWGFMAAAAKPGRPIPSDTEEQLVRFTALVATAVSNATTRTDLLTSRARVVNAADETRRRLERDLHDGIQQWLVALALRARKAASLTAKAESPVQELSSLADDLVAVTDELREISRGIHPAILTDAGLDDALDALVRRTAVRVDLDVRFLGRFDPTLEATVYYVVSESITNAVKHARASTLAVHGGRRDDTIELEITDDGIGGADPRRGTGLIGLQDRVDTLGGTISFASPIGGGTTIRVRLPTNPSVGDDPPRLSREGVSTASG